MGRFSDDISAWLDTVLEPHSYKLREPTSVKNIQYNLMAQIDVPLRNFLNYLICTDFPYEGLTLREVIAAIQEMEEADYQEVKKLQRGDS